MMSPGVRCLAGGRFLHPAAFMRGVGRQCYGIFTIVRSGVPTKMSANPLKEIICGDVPLARRIFGDSRKRRLIPQLVEDGWPIFNPAGKPCPSPADLDHHIASVARPRGSELRGSL